VVFVLVAAAFVVRTVLVLALRPVAPQAAAFVDRWWVWAPLAAISVWLVLQEPRFAVPVLVVLAVALVRDERVDLPFRRAR
jgi:hypothetical protein